MGKNNLLFYNEYEKFYKMVERSEVFGKFCRAACGEDLSQDGFGDMRQIGRIVGLLAEGQISEILDVGCGNGKLLGYIKDRREVNVHGFDFSENAIECARKNVDGDFRVCTVDEADYPENSFDMVISMDSIYFAADMGKFAGRVKKWLKTGGIFFIGYTEGDVVPLGDGAENSLAARALSGCGMDFETLDITGETYELLRRKRECAEALRSGFEAEGAMEWYNMIMGQTECAAGGFEKFAGKMARYIFIGRK